MGINKFKKLLSIVLTAFLLFSAVPTGITASAEVISGTTGDCTWTLDNGCLTISGNGRMKDYDTISFAPWPNGFRSVVIEQNVTRIGNGAFAGCAGLIDITIPDSVTSIGNGAFIGTAYYNNSDNWSEGVLYVGNNLIVADKEIVKGNYTIRQGTKCIADAAFYNCVGLSSITIPDSVVGVGEYAFEGCEIKELTIAEGSKEVTEKMVVSRNTLEKVTLPDSLIAIDNMAFWNCTELTSITIPDSVTSIGYSAFNNCK